MFKQFSILFLALVMLFESLIPKAIGISEASKMGELYEHFVSHQKEGVSLASFLWMHYSSDSKHKSNAEHKKLPCFECHQITVLSNEDIKTLKVENPYKLRVISSSDKKYKYCNNYKFLFTGAVLNPPRLG